MVYWPLAERQAGLDTLVGTIWLLGHLVGVSCLPYLPPKILVTLRLPIICCQCLFFLHKLINLGIGVRGTHWTVLIRLPFRLCYPKST